MATVTISLPEEIKSLAEAEAGRTGRTLDEYVANLILAQADQPVAPELEAQLLKGLNSPGRDFSASAWEEKKRRFEERLSRGE